MSHGISLGLGLKKEVQLKLGEPGSIGQNSWQLETSLEIVLLTLTSSDTANPRHKIKWQAFDDGEASESPGMAPCPPGGLETKPARKIAILRRHCERGQRRSHIPSSRAVTLCVLPVISRMLCF
ncbi:MAG: hypothetical protein JWN25_1938 [Verrucomicrobiales bacterium]|nr:hypothetical protein [Verrucomicrobiales bacterium]